MATSRDRQVPAGNRLVLIGAVMYLMEWVAIIAASPDAPFGPGTGPAEVIAGYAGQAEKLGWAAGWFSVVLVGRVVFVVGLRAGLVAAGRPTPLIDIAVAAMTMGVVLEVASYGLATAAAVLSDEGRAAGVLALDRAASEVNAMLIGPTGIAVVCAAVALWLAGLAPRILTILGLTGGAVLVLGALALGAPGHAHALDAATSAVVLVWVWMLWLGVRFWRRTPTTSSPSEPASLLV
jgi:hypothetical protein